MLKQTWLILLVLPFLNSSAFLWNCFLCQDRIIARKSLFDIRECTYEIERVCEQFLNNLIKMLKVLPLQPSTINKINECDSFICL